MTPLEISSSILFNANFDGPVWLPKKSWRDEGKGREKWEVFFRSLSKMKLARRKNKEEIKKNCYSHNVAKPWYKFKKVYGDTTYLIFTYHGCKFNCLRFFFSFFFCLKCQRLRLLVFPKKINKVSSFFFFFQNQTCFQTKLEFYEY